MSPSSSSVLAPPPSILAPSSSSTFSSYSSSDLFFLYNNCEHEICIAEGTIQRDKKEVHGKVVDEGCAAFIVERCHDNSFINPLDPFEEPMMPSMYTILPLAQCKQDLQDERHSEIRHKGKSNYLTAADRQNVTFQKKAGQQDEVCVGDIVGVPVHKVNRCNLDQTITPCKVIDASDKGIKLQCPSGVIRNKFTKCDLM